MMPLLCLYADFVGVLGGATVGMGMLDLSWTTYVRRDHACGWVDGPFRRHFQERGCTVCWSRFPAVYGAFNAQQFLRVGDAATSPWVTGIVAIVAACGIFAVVFYVLGI